MVGLMSAKDQGRERKQPIGTADPYAEPPGSARQSHPNGAQGRGGNGGAGSPGADTGGSPMGDQEPASPEEQAQYEQFIDNAFTLIYGQEMLPQVLNMLAGEGDPVDGLATVASTVVMRVEDSAQEEMELAEGVVFNAGVEIIEDLANLATEAGIHDFSEDEIEAAFYRALDLYRVERQQEGQIDQDAYAQEFERLLEMDEAGQLADLGKQATGHFKKSRPVDAFSPSGGQERGQGQAQAGARPSGERRQK